MDKYKRGMLFILSLFMVYPSLYISRTNVPAAADKVSPPAIRQEKARPLKGAISHEELRGMEISPVVLRYSEGKTEEILSNSSKLGINTLIFDLKECDRRGDIFENINVRVTNIGAAHATNITLKRRVERHLPNVLYESSVGDTNSVERGDVLIPDLESLIGHVESKGYHFGARIVCFKDYVMHKRLYVDNKAPRTTTITISNFNQSRWVKPQVTTNRESSLIVTNSVTITNKARYPNDYMFVDPLNPVVLEYDLKILKEIYDKGCRIFFLDYVRFGDPLEEEDYCPEIYLFNHVAMEQALKYLKKGFEEHIRSKGENSDDSLLIPCVYGRALVSEDDSGDPVGQNLYTFSEIFRCFAPMDYTHLLPAKFRDKPYEGRTKFLGTGIAKFGAKCVIPWVDGTGFRAPAEGASWRLFQEIKAAYDLGIRGFVIWNPSSRHDNVWEGLKRFNDYTDQLQQGTGLIADKK